MMAFVICKNCRHSCYLLDEYHEPYFWCVVYEDNFDEDREASCIMYKQKTSAEMIRSMTTEQLANFLIGFSYGSGKVSYDKILAWLNSYMED